jgi:hypothetical protein
VESSRTSSRDAGRRQAHAQAHLEQGRVLELEGRVRDPHEDHGADIVEPVENDADGVELGAAEGGELDDEAHAAADREDDAVAPAGRAELGREDIAVEAGSGVVGGSHGARALALTHRVCMYDAGFRIHVVKHLRGKRKVHH